MIPKKGKKVNGINAVIEIETASVIHQVTIQTAIAMTLSASTVTKGVGKLYKIKNKIGPAIKPIFFIIV